MHKKLTDMKPVDDFVTRIKADLTLRAAEDAELFPKVSTPSPDASEKTPPATSN